MHETGKIVGCGETAKMSSENEDNDLKSVVEGEECN